MPLLRGPDGFIVNADDEHAGQLLAGGYTPVDLAQASAETTAAPRNETGGALGAIGAAASSALSGVTLGASDWALKGILDDRDFERLANDRRAHPIISGAGQFAGALAPTIMSGGAATPAGALGRFTLGGIEAGKATGGAIGLAQQLAYAGGEGALQNAGIYLSDVALGDRKLTAEGINGALGTGLLFGAAGVPVMHGIEAGTVAARRMFARYAEGGAQAASDAAAAWTEQAQRHLEAFDQAADLAKAKLAETQTAREAASLQRLRANAEMADARAYTPPQEFPGAPASGAAEPGAAPLPTEAAAPAAPGAPVPGEPPEVAMARALRDRAKAMGGEPIAPGEVPPGAPGFRREYVIPGERPAPGPNALEQLAQQPGVTTAGPATSVREFGARAVPITADEAELGARLGEYQAARRAFDDLHAQVDPDLDAVLRGIEPGDIQRPPVPVGEFGAPGARGVKSQDTLARIAAGTGREEVAAAAPADLTGAGGPRALRAQGTPQARSLGEVAAEQAPVPIEPATAVGKRPAQVEATAAPAGRIEVHEVGRTEQMRATMPDGSTRDLGKNGADAFLAEQMPPGFRPAKVQTHRSFAVEHGLPATAADVAKLDENAIYIAKPSEIAERDVWGDPLKERNLADVAERWKRGEKLPPIDAYVTPEGRIYIEDGNHRLARAAQDGDRPVAIRFKDGTGYRPHGEAHEIGGRIRGDLPKDSGSARPAGIPDHATIKAHEVKADAPLEATVPAREIAARGYYEPPVRGGGTLEQADSVRMAKARQAIAEGQREPIDLNVTPGGKITVSGGRHRLQAAIEADAPIKVRWSTGSAEPAADDVLRHGPRSTASDTLTGQLRGTAAKVGEGETIGKIGAESPARAEYVTARAAKQKADAEHFRGKALEAREARAQAVAQGETPNPFHEPAGGAGPELDQFFKDLTAPKTRDAYVAQNIGRAMREEGSHAAALAKVEREWAERTATEAHDAAVERAPAAADTTLQRRMKTSAAAGLDPGFWSEMADIEAQRKALLGKFDNKIEDIRSTLRGHPLSVRQLEMAHDEAIERAATAADPAERAAATQEAQAIEKQMTQVGARPGAVEDIAALAPAVTRVEKAAAALTEALGDAAPAAAKEHAAAFRAAEDEASRKTTARIGQAADDAASARAKTAGDDLLGAPGPRQQRIAAAQKAQREAGAAYAKARLAEAEAQIGAKQAAGAAAEARAKLGPPPAAAPAGPGMGHRIVAGAHAVGYAAELGSDLGIPGIPRPHDIPVIGPLLSAYLKYRALRAAAGRFVGRVPATAETRAAALAAKTRDGVARAVDRSLGIIQRNANTVREALTVGTMKVTDALSKRLVDDGGPDAKAGASVSEQAAVRMREVAAVVANPALVQDAIRAQGRDMTDPDLIDALSSHLLNMFQRLNEVMPKGPPPNPFTGKAWTPSQADAIRFGQQVAIAKDPQVAFHMLESGTLTPTGAETLRRCYELLFRDGQARVIQRATELKNPVEYDQLLRLGRLFDVPTHPSLDPTNAAALAAAHTPAAKPAPSPASGGPPTASIANPTNLSSLYDAGGARRAGRI